MKHTQGEWKISKASGDFIYFVYAEFTGENAGKYQKEITRLSYTLNPQYYGVDMSKDEAEANAKLIAAAPQLFQMVRDLKDCIKRLSQDGLSQIDRDNEAQWEGEAHELLTSIDATYYKNANE